MDKNILDLDEFMERVQEDKELLFELLDIFLEDYQGKRKSLGEAITNKDFDQIKSVAHSLKGASGNISAKALREVLIKIEEMGKNNNLDGGEEFLKQLDAQFAELQSNIEEIKKEQS